MPNLAKIAELYKSKGITLKFLAQKVGMTSTGLIHAMKTDKIKLENLEKIAAALEVPITYFYDDQNKNTPIKMEHNGNGNIINFEQQKSNTELQKEIDALRREIALLNEIIKGKNELLDTYRTKKPSE